jgi:hypothetical protein
MNLVLGSSNIPGWNGFHLIITGSVGSLNLDPGISGLPTTNSSGFGQEEDMGNGACGSGGWWGGGEGGGGEKADDQSMTMTIWIGFNLITTGSVESQYLNSNVSGQLKTNSSRLGQEKDTGREGSRSGGSYDGGEGGGGEKAEDNVHLQATA